MARNTSTIGSGGGKPKPKPKKNPAGFGATPATPKRGAVPNIGAAIERGAKRGRTPPKPKGPKRPGLGATPGKPTAKPTKKLRGLQRETYKSLDLPTRKRLSRPVKGTYGLAREKPQPDTDISAGVHAERMRAQRAVRAADAYFTTREKKIDKGGRAAQQTLAEKDAVPTNAKDINKGARVVTRQYRRQALKAAVVGVATSGSKAASGRLNHVEKGLSSPDVLAGVGKAMQAIAGGPTRVKKGKGARLATSRSIPLAASREINRNIGNIGSLPVRTAKNTGQVLIESSDARKKLPADAVKAIPASVAGVVGAALDPKRAGKQITEDYARRYKPLVEGNDEEFRQRQKKEGVLPEVLDLSAAVGGGTAIAGRVLNTAGKARYAAGSRSTFARVAGAPRPKLRVAAGDTAAAVRTQEKHANILRNAARHATDAARKRKTEKLAKAPDASPEVRAAAASGGKEVVPLRKSTTKRAQRKAVAREKGSTTYRLKAKQQATQAESEANVRAATRRGKRSEKSTRKAALFYAQQFGIHTPEAARKYLGQRIRDIEAERLSMAEKGAKITSRNDELPVLRELADNADRYFTSDIAEGAVKQRGLAARVASEDPALGVTAAERAESALIRSYKPQADLLGIARREGEQTSEWVTRVAAEARRQGLEQPGYVPSWKRTKTVFSDRAAGGTRAVVPDKSYRGLNVAAGTQEPNPSLLTQQAMKNIKRGENWQLVSRHVENATIDTLPDVKTGEKLSFRNQTIKELNDNLERAGVDPNDVVIVNVGRVRESLAASARKADARPGDPITDPRFADPTEGLSDALEAGKHAATDERYVGTRGFYAFSKAAWKEIEADAKPSGALARSWDVSKGKVSRVLLGNPAWATIQTAANAFQTGMSGTGPVSFVEGQRFARVARRVTPENALRAEAAAGVHKWFDPQQHLGASAHNLIVDEWRAFKEGGLYQVAHKANPLDLIFRYDTMETNAFRRAVFYKNLRKQVYDKMGEDIGAVAAWQQRIGDALMFRSPRERMLKLLEDPEAIYKAAEATNDWLGDFTTRTAAERRILGRATMFYGFLRFSVKLAFYTLPVKHPLRALMLMQLGRLTVDEQKRIFGTEVPNYEIGNYYSPDGDMRLPTQRMNPFANAIQYETPRDIMRFGPPFLQLVLNQRDQSDAFGQTWRLDGKTAKLSDSDKVSLRNRFEVALGEFLRWNPGYRLAEKTGLDPLTGALTGASAGLPGVALGAILGGVAPQKPLEGRQGADSSLIFPQPTKYKPSKKGLPTVQSLLNPPKREPGDVANAKRIDRQRKDRVTARTDYFFPFGTPFTKPTSGKARIAEAKRYAAFKEEKKGKKKAGIPTLSQLLKGK